MDGDEELPRVTPALLRRADDMCRRRLAREHAGGKRYANKGSDARFAVSNRVVNDARLAHAEAGPVRAEAFVDPAELDPEQRHLYRAAVAGYLAVFGDRPGRSTDLGWRTSLPGLGVDLVGDVGLAIDPDDGPPELRIVKLGGRRQGAPLVDDVDLNVALVRTEGWAPRELRIIAVDVISLDSTEPSFDLATARQDAHAWLADRVARVKRNAAHGKAKPGGDCSGCAFIAGCGAHPQ